LSKIFDSKIRINGSGRTDAFVHANNQVFNFKAKKKFASVQLLKSLNEMLPNDIVVKDIENVNNKFHAQFNVILKEYVY
jgi:tRNA pseudouridine38-40 synthase